VRIIYVIKKCESKKHEYKNVRVKYVILKYERVKARILKCKS